MKLDLRGIRERKLVEWTLAYCAGAWVMLEVLAMAGDAFEWTPAALRLGFAVAILGLPVALVIAWYHGEKGRQRVGAAELTIIVGLLVLGGLVLARLASVGPARSDGQPVSIAVLPFETVGGEADDAFADGMHDELLHRLSKIGGLRVTSRTSVIGVRDREATISRDIAELLGVEYLVEGTARRSGNEVRMTVELIDPVTDDHLWSETYSATLSVENLFAIQSDIGTAIAGALAANLTPDERARISELPTRSLEAYAAFQRANVAFRDRFFSAGRAEAVEEYREAIELDPTFAEAYAQLARTLVFDFWFGRVAAADEAWRAVRSAEALDSASVDVHRALGDLLYYTQRDYERARAHYDRVLELEPSDAATLAQIGLMLNRQGRGLEAVGFLERSLRLDPRSALYADQLGILYGELYDGEAARRWAERALGLDPTNDTYRHRIMWAELCVNGDTVAARRFHASTEWSSAVEGARGNGELHLYRGQISQAGQILAEVPRSGLSRALLRHLEGDVTGVVALADSGLARLPDTLLTAARVEGRYKSQQPGRPWSERGTWEALRGNDLEGIRWARAGLEALSAEEDAVEHAWRRRDFIRVLTLTGRTDEAIRQIGISMGEPSDVGPGCYRRHPLYRSLRADAALEDALARAASRTPVEALPPPGA